MQLRLTSRENWIEREGKERGRRSCYAGFTFDLAVYTKDVCVVRGIQGTVLEGHYGFP